MLNFLRGLHVEWVTSTETAERRAALSRARVPEKVLDAPITSGARVTSAQRLDAIRPEVDALRAALFNGTTTPPFVPSGSGTRAKLQALTWAATWIKEEVSKTPPGPDPIETLEQTDQAAEIPARQARAEYAVRLHRRRLRFLRPARSRETTVGRLGGRALTVGWVDLPGPPMEVTEAAILLSREAHPEGIPPLWLLERCSHHWAKETGFRPWDLVTFVLTGIPPVLPPVRLTVTTWPPLEMSLQILAGDVTERTLFDLLRRARRAYRSTGGSPSSRRTRRSWPPSGGTGDRRPPGPRSASGGGSAAPSVGRASVPETTCGRTRIPSTTRSKQGPGPQGRGCPLLLRQALGCDDWR